MIAGEVRLKVSAARGRLYVTGPSHALAASIPGAAYNERRGAYEISLTLESLGALRKAARLSYDQFKQFCTPEVITWAERAAESNRIVAEAQNKIAAGWRPDDLPWEDNSPGPYRKPYDKQQIMAAVGILLDGSANLSQMGTGKTRALCEVMAYHFRERNIEIAVVACPKGVMGTWAREAPVWSKSLRVHRLGFRPGLKSEHPVAKRKEFLKEYRRAMMVENDPGFPNVILINYEVLYLVEDELLKLADTFKVGFFPDEMHKLANPQAKVTKTALKLAELATRRVGLTGTPQKDKTGEGLWSQWYIVDHGVTFGANNVQFRREWLDENPWTHQVEPKPGALEAMGQRIARRSVRFLKSDCLDLPEIIPVVREFQLSKDQQRVYDEMAETLSAELEGVGDDEISEAVATTAMAKYMRLAQISSGFVPIHGTDEIYYFDPNPKLQDLIEVIDSEIDQQQIIVWAYFRPNHDQLARELAKWKPVVIRGGMSATDHDRAEEAFQRGDARLLIGQQGAGGVGRNLQAASLAIWYSQQYSIVERDQSEGRNVRGGSEIHMARGITHMDMLGVGTIEWEIANGLKEKRSVAEVVVDLRRKLRGW